MRRNPFWFRIGSPIWVLAAVGVGSLTLLVYAERTWRDNLRRYVPLLDNLMQARVNLAQGHLRIEEMVTNDKIKPSEDVWNLFRQADQAIDHCLAGTSRIPHIEGLVLTDRALLNQLRNMKSLIDKLRKIGKQRLAHRKTSGIGSPSDRTFDATLGELQNRAQAIDQALHRRLGEIMVRQREVHAATLGLWGLLLAATCGGLQFLGTRRKQAEASAHAAQARLLEQQRNGTARIEAELDKLREQLVKRTRLATIGQVAASIAHELRNPLGAVRNAAYLLKRRSIGHEAGAAEYLAIIDHEVAAADRIIRDLLEMSRTKAPIKQSVDLGERIREALERVQPNEGLCCRWALEPDPFRVQADATQLGQVLFNLLSNAAQAMTGRGEIVVSAHRSADQDTILIHDSGPGITAEHRDRVFEPLFSTYAQGTGLGLTICRQIIVHHGGTLDLADDGKPGATFRIRLPRPAPD